MRKGQFIAWLVCPSDGRKAEYATAGVRFKMRGLKTASPVLLVHEEDITLVERIDSAIDNRSR